MVKQIIKVTHQCEVCGRKWDQDDIAQQCETSCQRVPELHVGDVVIWRGRRDLGNYQTLVYDQVQEVKEVVIPARPGKDVHFNLGKDHGFYSDHPRPDLQTGYVNLLGAIGYPGLHSDRMETALMLDHEDMPQIINLFRRAGIPLQDRIADIIYHMFSLSYANTWAGVRGTPLCKVPEAARPVLRFMTQEPTDRQCLRFVLEDENPEKWDHDHNPLDYNHFMQVWRGLAGSDINKAYQFLAKYTNEEIIAKVRQYREQVLRGEAPVAWRGARMLFPMRKGAERGKWTPEALQWNRDHNVKGSGSTRLLRTWQSIFGTSDYAQVQRPGELERLDVDENYFTHIWTDKQVIAVMAGKGGVGKSTVAADTARALAETGKKVCIIDLDFYGPSQELLFPVDDRRIKTQDGYMLPHKVDGVECFSIAYLLGKEEALTWRGPYLEVLMYMIGQHTKIDADIIILDMPPGTGDTHRAVLDLCPHARFLLVATAGELALSDLKRAVQGLGNRKGHVLGIVENMAYKRLDDGTTLWLWGECTEVMDVALSFDVPYFGALPMAKQANRLPIIKHKIVPQVLRGLGKPPREPKKKARTIQRGTVQMIFVDESKNIETVIEGAE